MKLKEFIKEMDVYESAAAQIKEWVERSYPGLSVEFNWPAPEVVQVEPSVRYTRRRVKKIIEAVNIKIGEVLEKNAERIYIAERLERIYERHPAFNPDIENMEALKAHPQFLNYLKELIQ